MITEMFEKKVLHFLKITGLHKAMETLRDTKVSEYMTFDRSIIPMGDRANFEKFDAELEKSANSIFGEVIMNGVITMITEKLCGEFSEDEIDEMIKVHETPTMQKYVKYASTSLAKDMLIFMGRASSKALEDRTRDMMDGPEDE